MRKGAKKIHMVQAPSVASTKRIKAKRRGWAYLHHGRFQFARLAVCPEQDFVQRTQVREHRPALEGVQLQPVADRDHFALTHSCWRPLTPDGVAAVTGDRLRASRVHLPLTVTVDVHHRSTPTVLRFSKHQARF
jgi:hypothetical protein